MLGDAVHLRELLEPTITALGYEFLGCIYMPQGHRSLLRIYIDKMQGITLADCELVSRQVSAVLDVEDPLSGTYTLEVSSPGEDRPLFQQGHFKRYLGARIQLRLQVPINKQRRLIGVLTKVDDEGITLLVDEQEFKLTWAGIARANLLPDVASKLRGKH